MNKIPVVIRISLTFALIYYSFLETGIVTSICLFLIFLTAEVQTLINKETIKTMKALAQKATNKVE